MAKKSPQVLPLAEPRTVDDYLAAAEANKARYDEQTRRNRALARQLHSAHVARSIYLSEQDPKNLPWVADQRREACIEEAFSRTKNGLNAGSQEMELLLAKLNRLRHLIDWEEAEAIARQELKIGLSALFRNPDISQSPECIAVLSIVHQGLTGADRFLDVLAPVASQDRALKSKDAIDAKIEKRNASANYRLFLENYHDWCLRLDKYRSVAAFCRDTFSKLEPDEKDKIPDTRTIADWCNELGGKPTEESADFMSLLKEK